MGTVPAGTTPALYVDGVKVEATYNPTTGTDTRGEAVSCGEEAVCVTVTDAAGTVGADIVAKARPDGYTLLLGHSNSNSVAPALYPKLPYDVVKDFTPIIRVASTPLLLTVNPGVPARDIKEYWREAARLRRLLNKGD